MYDNLYDWAHEFESDIESKYSQYKILKQYQPNCQEFLSLDKQLRLSHNRFDRYDIKIDLKLF